MIPVAAKTVASLAVLISLLFAGVYRCVHAADNRRRWYCLVCLLWGKSAKPNRVNERGSVVLEFALILPIFVLVGLMLVDIQWLTKDVAALEYITSETARCEAISSPACSAPNSPESYAMKLATDLKLETTDALKVQTPACTSAVCTVSATYQYKALGVYFPKMTIARSGSAAVK